MCRRALSRCAPSHAAVRQQEAALAQLLANAGVTPELARAMQTNVRDIVAAKDKLINELEDELARAKQRYYDTVDVFQGRMDEAGIPFSVSVGRGRCPEPAHLTAICVQELGFEPPTFGPVASPVATQ